MNLEQIKLCCCFISKKPRDRTSCKINTTKKVIRLTVSKKASPTSVEERKKLREFVYKKYFSNIDTLELDFDKIFTDRVYFLTGQRLNKKGNLLWVEKLSGFEGYMLFQKINYLIER
jgi:polynucleotide 5'-kinase involved in rRNA processing